MTTRLPVVGVQPSALEVIGDVDAGRVGQETFWVNVDDIETQVDVWNGTDQLHSSGPITVTKQAPRQLALTWGEQHADVKFARRHLFKYKDSITSIDVTHDGDIAVVGTDEGAVDVVSLAEGGTVRRKLGGHLLHCTKTMLFPSGQVALSTGSDMKLKVWNLADGANVRTMTGHKDQITDIAMIGRGRNLVSGARDNTVKLWECGSGKCIQNLSLDKPVRAVDIVSTGSTAAPHELLFDADGCEVVAAVSDSIVLWDMRADTPSLTIPVVDTAALATHGSLVVSGSDSGTVSLWDTRSPHEPLASVQAAPSPVIDLAVSDSKVAVVSAGRPDPVLLDLELLANPVFLAGGTNPITSAAWSSVGLVVGGKKGDIRIY